MAGKAVACFLTIAAVAVTLIVLGMVVFQIRPHSFLALCASLGAISLCFVGIMMLLSVMGKTEQSAGGIGWAIMVVLAMIGGGMIPLAFLPEWLESFNWISPIKWSILAMEGALWRQLTVGELLLPWGILVAVGLAAFALGAGLFRWYGVD